ncbi:hypothetical protein G7Y79_00011g030210 [Physcia stellaris]|nr:hypothetical protein G7Y79_00011g030210 [Physcia stellaris]
MSSHSPYAIAESEPPKWRPGEEIAAAAFIGIAIFLVVETNVEIFRVFRKRNGLYFWSLELGTWGVLLNVLGIILKYLSPVREAWPFYTLAMTTGWTAYTLGLMFVLYSRLHLVMQSHLVQRGVLIMILSTIFTMFLPTWVVIWPAWDPDPKLSSVWSPRDAIIERYTQIGFTIVECIISGIYIYSLFNLLHTKSSVRQRRVMIDLIYVNVIVIVFDVLQVVMVYLNQLGISHPIQTFSYILKLRLEFVVLNQLMAVAARGLRRETFADRRYHHSSTEDAFSAELKNFEESKPSWSDQEIESRQLPNRDDPSKGSTQISIPSPKGREGASPPPLEHQSSDDSMEPKEIHIPEIDAPTSRQGRLKAAIKLPRPRKRRSPSNSEERPISGHERNEDRNRSQWIEDDEEDDEMGLHAWENRGRIVLEVPWFRTTARDA